MAVTSAGIAMAGRAAQLLKTLVAMVVTEAGMFTCSMAVQPSKVAGLMVVMPSPRVAVRRAVQFANADSPR